MFVTSTELKKTESITERKTCHAWNYRSSEQFIINIISSNSLLSTAIGVSLI